MMKTNEAMRILNCSRATVHNWIKNGKLRLNKILPNGYRDIEDASVYEAVASTYEPSSPLNRIVMFMKDGRRKVFNPCDVDMRKIFDYLEERSRFQP